MKEILRAIVFLHRIVDHQDFTEVINCIPDSQMKVLEEALLARKVAGEIETVQVGRHRKQAHPLNPDEGDGVEAFIKKIDSKRLHSSMDRALPSEGKDLGSIPSVASTFTGFDDVDDPTAS